MDRSDAHISRFAAWFALLGGGVAWFARFLVVWIIAEFGCVAGALDVGGLRSPVVVLTIASLPFLAVALAATFVGWSRYRSGAASDEFGSGAASDEFRSGAASNEFGSGARFMAGTGAIASGIFVVIMIAEIIPIFYFMNECRSFSYLLSI